MKFIDELKKGFKERKKVIRVRGKVSGANWAEASITSLNEEPILLSTPIEEVKFRFQTLISGSVCFSPGNYRIDSHHNKPLHQHFMDSENPLDIQTLSGALVKILGGEFEVLNQ